MEHRPVIVWFRQDLRIHDNEALTKAISTGRPILPVYVFDERVFEGSTHFGFRKTGLFRAKLILECVNNLRINVQKLGADLIIRTGKPEEEIFNLAKETHAISVCCNRERTDEEVNVQDMLERNLWTLGIEIQYYRGKMLFHTSDLPFPVSQTPDVFTQFRKEVEKYVPVRQPLPSPLTIPKYYPVKELGSPPSLRDWGFNESATCNQFDISFEGGEDEAIARLKYYLWDTDLIKQYKETRNGLLGMDYSSKLSPFLAAGCLSPKLIYQEVREYEQNKGANKSTYWLIFELLWRDFFRFIGKKYGNEIFKISGTAQRRNISKKVDWDIFDRWASGQTGVPFIDANMRELNQTGFMSNRGRQNVASFLVKDLKLNWLLGAEYFESLLIDYDPCSNYGNWNYVAGVGSDPRENRYFNILTQAKRYDPEGNFIKYWLPELKELNETSIFAPQKGTVVDYPAPLVDFKKWN
jgi:deoxyribodipyrimidine photo-lyase